MTVRRISPNKEVKTRNREFNETGVFLAPNLLKLDVTSSKDILARFPKGSAVRFNEKGEAVIKTENQVAQSLAIINNPEFEIIHDRVGELVGAALGVELLKTYYYERFYFKGQNLGRHTDRPACEVSVTIHIDNNLEDADWPIFFQTLDKSIKGYTTDKNDAVIYQGRACEHWRAPLQINSEDGYYRQLFMHYVIKGGHCSHYAGDNHNHIH